MQLILRQTWNTLYSFLFWICRSNRRI